jgi:hypothetical protein
MLVYVLIYLTGGVVDECDCFTDEANARAMYDKWTEDQPSKDDVLLFACQPDDPTFDHTIAVSIGEG